jgi:hypothetical protein
MALPSSAACADEPNASASAAAQQKDTIRTTDFLPVFAMIVIPFLSDEVAIIFLSAWSYSTSA